MDINVQIVDMDVMVGEQITENEDGSVTIFLNARHTQENRLRYYKHAMKHLKNDDFKKDNVDKIEFEAHNLETASEFCG